MIFHILTIFPEMFQGFLNESILKKAQGKGFIQIHLHDIRDYSKDKHRKVDDTPYGGGAGMVFTPQPLFDCIEAVLQKIRTLRLRSVQESKIKSSEPQITADLSDYADASFGGGVARRQGRPPLDKGGRGDWGRRMPKVPVIYLSPRGQRLTQIRAERLNKKFDQYILICGHYEGIDQRVIDSLVDFELSIGDFVLSGGELAAMVFVDVMSRLTPGVLGNDESHEEETFSKRLGRKKEYPHYTRPAEFRGMKVPEVLLNGNHAEIEKWRRGQLK